MERRQSNWNVGNATDMSWTFMNSLGESVLLHQPNVHLRNTWNGANSGHDVPVNPVGENGSYWETRNQFGEEAGQLNWIPGCYLRSPEENIGYSSNSVGSHFENNNRFLEPGRYYVNPKCSVSVVIGGESNMGNWMPRNPLNDQSVGPNWATMTNSPTGNSLTWNQESNYIQMPEPIFNGLYVSNNNQNEQPQFNTSTFNARLDPGNWLTTEENDRVPRLSVNEGMSIDEGKSLIAFFF